MESYLSSNCSIKNCSYLKFGVNHRTKINYLDRRVLFVTISLKCSKNVCCLSHHDIKISWIISYCQQLIKTKHIKMKFELPLGCWLILAIFQETYSRKIYGVDSTDSLLDQETSSLDRNDIEKGNSYCLVLHNVEVNTRISIFYIEYFLMRKKFICGVFSWNFIITHWGMKDHSS